MSAIAKLGLFGGACGLLGFALNHAHLCKKILDICRRWRSLVVNQRMEENRNLLERSFEKLERAWREIQSHPEKITPQQQAEFEVALHVHAFVYKALFQAHPESSQELADLSFKQFTSEPADLKMMDRKIQERRESIVALCEYFTKAHESYLEKAKAFNEDCQDIEVLQTSVLASKERSYMFKVGYGVFTVSLVIFRSLALTKGAGILLVTLGLMRVDQEFIGAMELFKKLMHNIRAWTERTDRIGQQDLERRAEAFLKMEEFYQAQYSLVEEEGQLQVVGEGQIEPQRVSLKAVFPGMVVKKEEIENEIDDQNTRLEAFGEKAQKVVQTLLITFV